jgi:hypothetical protein
MDRNRKAELQEEQRRANQQASEDRMARFVKSEAAAKARREAAEDDRPVKDQTKADAPAAVE